MQTSSIITELFQINPFLKRIPLCNTRLWKITFNFTHLLLHAVELRLTYPVSGEELTSRAVEQEMIRRWREVLGLARSF
ncbi:MAG: hypothetical protein CMN32_09120 [Saprospirales bacterium]|nr:hypothetical protein [Saprospirales bacterium]